MPPATTSLAPVTAALDLKESGVTKVIHRGSPQAGGSGKGPREAGSREIPMGTTGFYKDSL